MPLECFKLHNFRGAASHPAVGANTHIRIPSLALPPCAFSTQQSVSHWFSKVSPPTEKLWFDALRLVPPAYGKSVSQWLSKVSLSSEKFCFDALRVKRTYTLTLPVSVFLLATLIRASKCRNVIGEILYLCQAVSLVSVKCTYRCL